MIRVPLTSLHAPWVLLFTIAMAAVLIVAAAGAGMVLRPPARLLTVLVAAVVLAKAGRRAAGNALVLARAWREDHRTRRGLERRLRALDAWDGKDFCGRGIPRRDWAKFNDELADLLWQLRVAERRRKQ